MIDKKQIKIFLPDKHIETYNLNNKNIIKITIDEASYLQKPIFINGDINNTFIRRNSADTRATQDDLKILFSNSIEETDGEILKHFDISDMNDATIENYRNNLVEETGNTDYLYMTYEEFLISIGAYRVDRTGDKKPKPTKGALLLFGKYNSILEIFPSFQLDYFEKNNSDNRWIDRVSTGDMSFQNLNNIYDFYNVVTKKIYDSSKDPFVLDKSTQQRLPFKRDLQESVREALVNSLMHSLYDSDFPIKITLFPDYYEFENPGQMRVSIEEFISGKTSRIRNHVIANLFRKVGISEKAASGGFKIFKTAQKYKLKSPELLRGFDKTIIRIWKIDITQSFKDLTELEQEVMMYVVNNSYINKSLLISEFKMTPQTSRTTLEKLIKKNYLVKIGKSRATKYILPFDSKENYIMMKKLIKLFEDKIDNRK